MSFVFILVQHSSIAQATGSTPPLHVVSQIATLNNSIVKDSAQRLVELKHTIPNIAIELRYATAYNCCHKAIYNHHPTAWLRILPAQQLKLAQAELNKAGLTLKVYDAYRPYRHTLTIWQAATDRHYTANPRKGSNHNRGLAIDVTLADLKTGNELDMGTPFDSFTDTAHHDFYNLPANILANRRLLKNTLRKYGFTHVPSEWWHYQYRNNRNYDVLDIDFDELKSQLKQ